MGAQVRAHASAFLRRVGDKLADWDGANLDAKAVPPPTGRLHRWLPFAIVLVSLGAAAMGWQASVADERATHRDEFSRQDLVRLAQLRLQKVQDVDADIRMFGEFEKHWLLSRELARDARRAGSQERRRLAGQARADRTVANSIYGKLRFVPVNAVPGRTGYDVRYAITQAESGDDDLSSLEPNPLRSAAHKQRQRALNITVLAVGFIVGLVFFTLAAVSRGRRASTFAGMGAGAALGAALLFPFFRGIF